MTTYHYEYTDTFGGEANYCWVKRGYVSVANTSAGGHVGATGSQKGSDRMRAAVRKVKAALGITGVRCSREKYGDDIVLRPRGHATIVFVTLCED